MKFIILGFPHCGTCSLEKYLVEQGHDVVRMEGGYIRRTVDQVCQLYPDHKAILITREGKDYDYDKFYEKLKDLNPQFVRLEDMCKKPDFPWENKGDCLSKAGIRPIYKKNG